MSARDRTLLSQLGFADPDKRNPKHDLACQYLCDIHTQHQLLNQLADLHDWPRKCLHADYLQSEFAISKGHHQYKVTVGFLDVVGRIFQYEWSDSKVKGDRSGPLSDAVIRDKCQALRKLLPEGAKVSISDFARRSVCGVICMEVKAGEFSVGDAIRQINLYKEHLSEIHYYPYERTNLDGWPLNKAVWVLATLTSLSPSNIKFLYNHGIRHVYLGKGFETWLKEREADATDVSKLSVVL